MRNPESTPVNRYTVREIKLILSRHRKKQIPKSTWEYWKSQLGIKPVNGFYEQEDLDVLIGLIKALKRGLSIANYVQSIQLEGQKNGSQSEQRQSSTEIQYSVSSDPIEVTATTV